MSMKRLILILAAFFTLTSQARVLPVRSAEDATRIQEILGILQATEGETGDRMVAAALALQGAGEDDYYTVDSVANLRINTGTFTPLMFVNTVIALAKASEKAGTIDLNTFSSEFENISSRKGEAKGFPSVMYHASDWIIDNTARGNITELTENYSGVVARTKSLDEMTRKRGNFAALADSATFEAVRMTEMGFRTHRIPSLKKETIKKKEVVEDLRNGDIILMVPGRDGIDIYDMGFVTLENGLPYLIHLSPQSHTVVKEKEDLARYMNLMTKYFQGYRILRVKQ